MEEQLRVLMEKLQSGMEHAPDIYYGLRNEYFVYEVLSYLEMVAGCFTVFGVGLIGVTFLIGYDEKTRNMNNPAMKQWDIWICQKRRNLIIFTIVMIMICITCYGLQYFLAPDITFLNKVKQ